MWAREGSRAVRPARFTIQIVRCCSIWSNDGVLSIAISGGCRMIPVKSGRRLDRGAGTADAIIATGGASAGDEDHVSRMLRDEGTLQTWRVAIKPGRPLAMAVWRDRPVFGLPGNPVAAFVCALIFALPALRVLAGENWSDPHGFLVPSGFAKQKKPGRREYLRARIDANGRAIPFASEGSGRISGLSWSDGLIELEHGALSVREEDPVRYLPYSVFGL